MLSRVSDRVPIFDVVDAKVDVATDSHDVSICLLEEKPLHL